MTHPELAPTVIGITLGGGVSLSITQDNDLIVEDAFIRFSLGRATQRNFDNLIEYLNRLKIHAVE